TTSEVGSYFLDHHRFLVILACPDRTVFIYVPICFLYRNPCVISLNLACSPPIISSLIPIALDSTSREALPRNRIHRLRNVIRSLDLLEAFGDARGLMIWRATRSGSELDVASEPSSSPTM